MNIYKNLLAFMAFFSIVIAAPSNFTHEKDNPILTCLTQPCVQVDGVGKIMGSYKVRILKSIYILLVAILDWYPGASGFS